MKRRLTMAKKPKSCAGKAGMAKAKCEAGKAGRAGWRALSATAVSAAGCVRRCVSACAKG